MWSLTEALLCRCCSSWVPGISVITNALIMGDMSSAVALWPLIAAAYRMSHSRCLVIHVLNTRALCTVQPCGVFKPSFISAHCVRVVRSGHYLRTGQIYVLRRLQILAWSLRKFLAYWLPLFSSLYLKEPCMLLHREFVVVWNWYDF